MEEEVAIICTEAFEFTPWLALIWAQAGTLEDQLRTSASCLTLDRFAS